MNFLKRALMAVSRKKGKTIIMFIIFAAIANMVLAGLAIQHATEYAGELARQKLGGVLTLSFNMQKALEDARSQDQNGGQRPNIQTEPITDKMVKTVASQKNIVDYNCIVNTSGLAQGFTAVKTDDSQNDNQDQNQGNSRFGNGNGNSNFVMPDVTVVGVSSTTLMDDFKNGGSKLVSGRAIKSSDSNGKAALIEQNLADQNKLKVGDKISVKATRSSDVVQYTIVGIYKSSTTNSSTSGFGMRNMSFTQPYNRIYVDYQDAVPLKTVTSDTSSTAVQSEGIDEALFYIDDPKDIDAVEADIKKMDIDWNKFSIDADDAAYKQMTGPIENVASSSMTMVYLVAVAGAVILGLILLLSMKERMYETGVLLSMGEGKMKIIMQYVAEVLIIAIVAFSLSIFSGKYIGQGVGSMLLSKQITATQQTDTNNSGNFAGNGGGGNRGIGRGFGGGGLRAVLSGGQSLGNIKPIDTLNIQITDKEVGELSLAGLIIILAGTILPAINIMRYKPKTILTKAS